MQIKQLDEVIKHLESSRIKTRVEIERDEALLAQLEAKEQIVTRQMKAEQDALAEKEEKAKYLRKQLELTESSISSVRFALQRARIYASSVKQTRGVRPSV
jgi:chromosome segregation ATPase